MKSKPVKLFENSWEHLLAELQRLDLLIQREVLKSRQSATKTQEEMFKGMFISDGEIDQLLDASLTAAAQSPRAAAAQKAAVALQKQTAQSRQASLEQGIFLTLPHLAYLFGLTPFEEQIILLCLAPELDLKYEKLYAYLQDDVTRKKPGVALAMRLLCGTPEEMIQARACFSEQASLIKSQILRYLDGGDNPLPARVMKLDEAVTNFLLGIANLSKAISACCRFSTASIDVQSLRWPEGFTARLLGVIGDHLKSAQRATRKLILHFYGPDGTGKKSLATAACREMNLPLLIVDMREVLLRAQPFEETLRLICREAILQPAALYLEHFDLLLGDDDKSLAHRQVIARAIEEFSWLTFIATQQAWEPDGLFKAHLFLKVELPTPGMLARAELWKSLTAERADIAPEVNCEELATKFRLTPGQIQNALIAARNSAHWREGEGATVTMEDLYSGCRFQSNQKLGTLARKLSPKNGWADITLSDHALAQLHEICAQVKHRQTVYGKWGFGRKRAFGKGLCVLFYGQSGTGKTLAVEVIANELQLEAFRIDLSSVVSKYIGETEKNLSRVFQEAETSNAILFFDEADALFGKRSEVKDAHDRYANIEISYLLQRMEEFEGLVILASNLRKNIDDAFFRRMHFAVEFPFPDAGHRYRIWRQHFPEQAPIAEDIDFDFLANRIHIAGGNIKNITVNAAFLAAANSGVIHMKDLIQATLREYQKMGKLCTDADFAPYHALLRGS
ncbi:MAG TPA: ATP-binding protein [Blastocatellia bacterium]|nr:ATP-binding protein [Blastocatellia bacterium]